MKIVLILIIIWLICLTVSHYELKDFSIEMALCFVKRAQIQERFNNTTIKAFELIAEID